MFNIHQYFIRKFAEWNICGYLDECQIQDFNKKIEVYINSLELIAKTKKDGRADQAGARPDYQLATDWKARNSQETVNTPSPECSSDLVIGCSYSIAGKRYQAEELVENTPIKKNRSELELLTTPPPMIATIPTKDLSIYCTAVKAVENVQKKDESANNDPLWWGVLDFREDNVYPCPDNLRAENLLPKAEVDRLINALKGAIKEEKGKISKSTESFLEALVLSDLISIRHLSKECGAYGVSGLYYLLRKSAENMKDNEKKGFKLTLEISMFTMMKLFIDKWVTCFAGECQSERTVDMFVVGPYAKTPHTVFLYGENRSDADREDKANRSGANCVGKACDFLYRNSSRETGVGENSGPTHKDNHDKSVTNFIEVIKVAKSQHKKLQNHIIEQCGNKTLPKNLQNELESIFIPFFQIIGMKIRFYLLFQINGDLYGIWDWASEIIPTNDEDIGEANFVARAERMTNILSKRAKVYKLRHPEEFTPRSIKLNQLQTPNKKNNRKERENGHNNDV
ncbi:hypothetical protein C2G38_2189290 [Gigaspora rosea]|uniref:Uncharacterized protein n=1 Tax=Gigaspora rosea TaxID=44941 RepID=A0A397V9M7_9GLOM|nr:hypothetical protein C2G38_2189290 [Gigaspora rosea]